MDQLQVREAEIFRVLKLVEKSEFVLIGGYAVNSYTLPRFSVDCDLVVRRDKLQSIVEVLKSEGFVIRDSSDTTPYGGSFVRLEKTLPNGFNASFDILIDTIFDRQSKATFGVNWIFENSTIQSLVGKTIRERIIARVSSADALFVMKLASGRITDCRDLFMLAPVVKSPKWIRSESSKFFDFQKNARVVLEKVSGPKFKNNLAGVYGYIDEVVFKKHLDTLQKICGASE